MDTEVLEALLKPLLGLVGFYLGTFTIAVWKLMENFGYDLQTAMKEANSFLIMTYSILLSRILDKFRRRK